MLTMQEIFDNSVSPLLKQGRKSLENPEKGWNACQFRGADGAKCAVGWLIPDDRYSPWMDRSGALTEIDEVDPDLVQELDAIIGDIVPKNSRYQLLADLQYVHDTYTVEEWPDQFSLIARHFKLSTAVIDAYEASQATV